MTGVDGIARVLRRVERLWREGRTDAAAHWDGYVAWRDHLARLGIRDVSGIRVLDIGCGDRAQMAALLASDGATVVGLDMQAISLGWRRPTMWFSATVSSGPIAGLHLAVRDLLHTFRYWRVLATLAGRALPFRRIRFVQGDAADLPFTEGTFDLVVSSAVWEHLSDVGRASKEVNRVLAPDGLAIIQIALFPAIQGGHHQDWHSVDGSHQRMVQPWDHLRPNRRPLPLYLNEWRESQYRESMGESLDVLEWEDGPERGREYLDRESIAGLEGYTDRDLLLSSLTVWAKRRSDPVILGRVPTTKPYEQ